MFVPLIDKLVASIEAELKKLQRRKLISTEELLSRSPQSAMICSPSVSSPAGSSVGSGKEQPLFTLKHVTMVCQRMLKEREEQLRGEYDKLLAAKLAGIAL